MDEVWKDIPGYEGRYQASNLGRIKSLSREVRCGREGRAIRRTSERILSPGPSRSGHLSVVLGHKEHGSQVHQLVMSTFVGPKPKGMEICHENGDPSDNRLSNLRYDTRRENILDVYRQGKRWRKLNSDEAEEIKKRLLAGERGADLAREFSISQTTVWKIKVGRAYQWL